MRRALYIGMSARFLTKKRGCGETTIAPYFYDDPGFRNLVIKGNEKGLKVRKNAMLMGFCLTHPDGSEKKFKSFSSLKSYVENYTSPVAA